MKLEFVEDGSPDCPLIRLYEFDSAEALRLQEILGSLANGAFHRFDLHKAPLIQPIRGCELTLQLHQPDLGIIRCGSCSFNCAFGAETWRAMAALVEPFCESATPGSYQWLTEQGDAFLLLSPDGSW